jgi:hypothetical protein
MYCIQVAQNRRALFNTSLNSLLILPVIPQDFMGKFT